MQKASTLIASLFSRHLSYGAALTVVLQFGGAAVTFLMYLLAARVLTSTDFGHLAMWLCVCQMGSIAALFGQEMFILRSLNEYGVAERPDLAKGALLFSVGITATFPLLVAIVIGTVGIFLLDETPRLMLATGLFLVASASVGLFSHIGRSAVSILVAESTRDLVWRTLVIAVLLAFIATGTIIHIDQLFLLSTAGIGVSLVIQGTAIARAIPREVVAAAPAWDTRRWVAESTGFWASAILESINQYFDVVIVYWFLDPAPAGAYFVASRLANMFTVPLTALHSFSTRRIPALYFGNKRDELNQVLRHMAEVMALCIAAGVAVLVFGAGTVLSLFGPQFAAQKWTLIILAIGTALYSAGGPAPSMLMIGGRQARYPLIVAANIGLRFLGFAVLIPIFGLKGAALAAASSLIIITVALNVLCRRWLGYDPSLLVLLRRPATRPVRTQPLVACALEPKGSLDATR